MNELQYMWSVSKRRGTWFKLVENQQFRDSLYEVNHNKKGQTMWWFGLGPGSVVTLTVEPIGNELQRWNHYDQHPADMTVYYKNTQDTGQVCLHFNLWSLSSEWAVEFDIQYLHKLFIYMFKNEKYHVWAGGRGCNIIRCTGYKDCPISQCTV